MKSKMSVIEGVRFALDLLSARDQRRLVVVVVLQAGLAFLDLAGILIIGVVAALAASEATGQQTPLGSLFPMLGSRTIDVEGLVVLAAVGD